MDSLLLLSVNYSNAPSLRPYEPAKQSHTAAIAVLSSSRKPMP